MKTFAMFSNRLIVDYSLCFQLDRFSCDSANFARNRSSSASFNKSRKLVNLPNKMIQLFQHRGSICHENIHKHSCIAGPQRDWCRESHPPPMPDHFIFSTDLGDGVDKCTGE